MPPLDVVLDSITRRLVLDIGVNLGFHHEVRPVLWAEVESADELFLCSTNAPVAPVSRLDDHRWPDVGPVSQAITSEIAAMIDDPEHQLARRWLTPL